MAGDGGGGGDAVAGGGGGGGEADRCGDVVFSFRFFALSVVCCRGSLGGSRKGFFVILARGAKPLAAYLPFITSPRLPRFGCATGRCAHGRLLNMCVICGSAQGEYMCTSS